MGWGTTGIEGSYPKRDGMLQDLLQHHQLKGLNYQQLIELTGQPDRKDAGIVSKCYYSISAEYGHDTDLVYAKTLIFIINSKNIVTGYCIEEFVQ